MIYTCIRTIHNTFLIDLSFFIHFIDINIWVEKLNRTYFSFNSNRRFKKNEGKQLLIVYSILENHKKNECEKKLCKFLFYIEERSRGLDFLSRNYMISCLFLVWP